jgi:hypothetical protein
VIEGQYLKRRTVIKLSAPLNTGICLKVEEIPKIIKFENNSRIKCILFQGNPFE